jgi:hypothetical protein
MQWPAQEAFIDPEATNVPWQPDGATRKGDTALSISPV